MVDWTEAMVRDLRALWETGLSAGRIGYEMGLSKNSIIGKAHRLGLPGRPSPIKSEITKPSKKARPKLTLEPLPSAVVNEMFRDYASPIRGVVVPPPAKPWPKLTDEDARFPEVYTPAPTPRPVVVAPPPPPAPAPITRARQCCDMTQAGPAQWVQCDNPAQPGKSWCEAHARKYLVSARRQAAG